MKKLLICLLLVCFIATNFAACIKQGSVGDINTEIDTSENTHTSPPRVIVFESVEELIEHKNLLNKSEEEKRKYYLSKGTFNNMSELTSDEEIKAFFDKIGNLPILHLNEASGYNLGYIQYTKDYGTIETVYKNENGFIRFYRYLPESKLLNNTDEKETISRPIAKEKLTVLNQTLDFQIMNDDEDCYRLFGRLNAFDSYVLLYLTDNAKKGFDLAAIEQNIVETTLNELMQQKASEIAIK